MYQTVNERINTEIELGGGFFIVGADVVINIGFDSEGDIDEIVPRIEQMYIAEENGQEFIPTDKNWDIAGLEKMVIADIDWDLQAGLWADYRAYKIACDEYKAEMAYNLWKESEINY